jgi:3alpha(or 20beta)-hydroxysteroid dehydrogenase
MGKLSGKVALITGAASGIGAAQAALFVREGARVLLCDVNPTGEVLATRLGPQAAFCRLDVASEVQWQSAVAALEQRFGRWDILVNCAGIAVIRPLEETTVEDCERQFRVNQLGTFLGIRAAIGPMRRIGGGSIVNISSGAGLKAVPSMTAYAGTKAAIRGLTKSAAGELVKYKIRVNAIFPGAIDTPLLQQNTDEFNRTLAALTPMGRLGTAEEIAAATLFLASDDAAYVTGADLAVDGGVTA